MHANSSRVTGGESMSACEITIASASINFFVLFYFVMEEKKDALVDNLDLDYVVFIA